MLVPNKYFKVKLTPYLYQSVFGYHRVRRSDLARAQAGHGNFLELLCLMSTKENPAYG